MKMLMTFLDTPMCLTRLLLALSSLTWAFILFTTGHLFTGRPTYDVMAAIAGENVWAFPFTVHGCIAMYTLFTNSRNRVTLLLDGLLGCVIWTASTAACFSAYWPHADSFWISLTTYKPPAALSADIWMSVAAWWHFIKHWAEFKEDEDVRGS